MILNFESVPTEAVFTNHKSTTTDWNAFQRKLLLEYISKKICHAFNGFLDWKRNTTRTDALFRNYVEENANIEIAQLL